MSLLGLPNETIHAILQDQSDLKTLRAVAFTSRRLWEIVVPLLYATVVVSMKEDQVVLPPVLRRKELSNYVTTLVIYEQLSRIRNGDERGAEGTIADRGSNKPNEAWENTASVASSRLSILDRTPNLLKMKLMLLTSPSLFTSIRAYGASVPAGLSNLTHLNIMHINRYITYEALITCLFLPALCPLVAFEAIDFNSSNNPQAMSHVNTAHMMSNVIDLTLGMSTLGARALSDVLAMPKGLRSFTFQLSPMQLRLTANDILRALGGSRKTLRSLIFHCHRGSLPSLDNFSALRSLQTDLPALISSTMPITPLPDSLEDLELTVNADLRPLENLVTMLASKHAAGLKRFHLRGRYENKVSWDARFRQVCRSVGVDFKSEAAT